MRVAVYNKIKDDLATCDLAEGIASNDESMIAQAMKQKYGLVNEVLLNHAIEIYNEKIVNPDHHQVDVEPLLTPEEQAYLKKQTFDADGIKSLFEWSLDRFGILKTDDNPNGFQVIISPQATSIDVRDKSAQGPTVFIPETRQVNGVKALEVIAHEIRGHARQSINGHTRFLIGGGNLKFDNETLYEGLAKRYDEDFHHQFFGKTTGKPEPWFTLAVARAETGASFHETFHVQCMGYYL